MALKVAFQAQDIEKYRGLTLDLRSSSLAVLIRRLLTSPPRDRGCFPGQATFS